MFWILELNKIYNEDCLLGLKKLQNNTINLITTDPPYGKDYKSNWSNVFDKIKNDKDLIWLDELFRELNRVSKDDSHLYCFTSVENMGEFMMEIKKYWKIKNIIAIPRTMKGGIGDLKSSFSPQNEFVIFATKGKRAFEETKILKPSEIYLKDKRKNPKEWIYRLPDYWEWLKASVHNLKRIHPTEKTVEVMETMINLSSKEGETILDPFMGSGTTALACIKSNRKYIGFELDKGYYDVANKRIESYFKLVNDN